MTARMARQTNERTANRISGSNRRVDRDVRNSSVESTVQRGESTIAYNPSNASTVQAGEKAGGQTRQTMAKHKESLGNHSRRTADRSQHYHASVVESTYTRPSATKMTKAQHQLNNPEDMGEGWGSSQHNAYLGAK